MVERLTGVPLFSACTKSDLKIVARHLDVVEIPGATKVVVEGDEGDAFFIILDGEASVRRGTRKVASLGPGNHFGELALWRPARRNATVVTSTDSTMGVLDARTFRMLLRDLSGMSRRLLGSLAERIRNLDRTLYG